MANKPNETLDWAGTQSDATTGKKAAGFSPTERPGAQLFNWILGLISAWILYLRDAIFRNGDDATAVTISAGFADSDGSVRHFFDSNGMLGGRVFYKEFHWAFPHKTADQITDETIPTPSWNPQFAGTSQWSLAKNNPGDEFSWFGDAPLTASDQLAIPIPLKTGQRLRQVDVYVDGPSSGDLDLTLYWANKGVSPTRTDLDTVTSVGAGTQTLSLTPSTPYELNEGDELQIVVEEGAAVTGDCFVQGAKMFYDDGIVDVLFGGSGLHYSRSEDNVNVQTRAASSTTAVSVARIAINDPASSEGASVHSLPDVDGGDNATVRPSNNSIVVFECPVRMSAVGANEIDVFIGLHDDPRLVVDPNYGDPASYTLAGFRKLSSETNWFACTTDTGDPQVDTGVAPPGGSTMQFLRMEIHGVNTPLGVANSAETIRYFIDGVLVHEEILAVSLATQLGIGIHAEATATGPAANWTMDILPLRLVVTPFTGTFELAE